MSQRLAAGVIGGGKRDPIAALVNFRLHDGDNIPRYMYQDTGMTTPAVTNGDPVMKVIDPSSGRILTFSSPAFLRFFGDVPVLHIDASTSTAVFSVPSGLDKTIKIITAKPDSDSTNYYWFAMNNDRSAALSGFGQSTVDSFDNGGVSRIAMGATDTTQFRTYAVASQASGARTYRDLTPGGTGSAILTTTETEWVIFGGDGGITPFKGYFTGFALVNQEVLDGELEGKISWQMGLRPAPGDTLVPLPDLEFEFVPTTFDHSSWQTADGPFFRTAAMASQTIETTATAIDFTINSDIYSYYPAFAEVGIYLNGEPFTSILTNSSQKTRRLTFPAGTKQITIVNGLQTSLGTTPIRGTYLQRLDANAAMSRVLPTYDSTLVVYGDSIAVGADADIPTFHGWVMRLRALRPDLNVCLEAWGFRSLDDDTKTTELRDDLVDRIESYSPDYIYQAIGTNDFGISKASAATTGTRYASLLTDLNAAAPSAQIYCQTPLSRTDENTPNTFGNTLANYRTAIASAVSGKAYCTLVNGPSIMTNTRMPDGVHPDNAGQDLQAAFVAALIPS